MNKITIAILTTLTLLPSLQSIWAGSAIWNLNPATGDWNTAANWTPATVPNGPTDDATFDVSNKVAITLTTDTTVHDVIFDSDASAFRITTVGATLIIGGNGIVNNSGLLQNFVSNANSKPQPGLIAFTGNASAGALTLFTTNALPGGTTSTVSFSDSANAGTASFINNGSTESGVFGTTEFNNNASASSADFTNNGCPTKIGTLGNGGMTLFRDTATAGDGNFTCLGSPAINGSAGGAALFFDNSTAGSATFTTDAGIPDSGTGGNGGLVSFTNSSTAANCTITNNGSVAGSFAAGFTGFGTSATAGTATIVNKGGTSNGVIGGQTGFSGSATLDHALVTNEGGIVSGAAGGNIVFQQGGNAGNATIVNNGGTVSGSYGGTAEFNLDSNAGNSTLIANGGQGSHSGGTINFDSNSDGGTCRLILSGNGNLLLNFHDATPVTVGSIEGDGVVFIANADLIVGSNNRDAIFAGGIDSGAGSVTKIGPGIWTLRGASEYTGGTFINGGQLIANNHTGSATGLGPVQVNAGTLAGKGTIAGAVIVGDNAGRKARLLPGSRGDKNIGTLTIQGSLTFNSDASYSFQVDSDNSQSDTVVASVTTINSGAQFAATDLGTSTLTAGTVFTALRNSSATPVTGMFANLADGGTLTIGSNAFQANYEGGDGNDLTLTVIP